MRSLSHLLVEAKCVHEQDGLCDDPRRASRIVGRKVQEGAAMTDSWGDPARALCEREPATWEGLWSLLYAAARAASTLALATPVHEGIGPTLTAMDLNEAREELDWVRPGLRATAPVVSLGNLPAGEDRRGAAKAIECLAYACAVRVLALRPAACTEADGAALVRVLALLRSASKSLDAPWAA